MEDFELKMIWLDELWKSWKEFQTSTELTTIINVAKETLKTAKSKGQGKGFGK